MYYKKAALVIILGVAVFYSLALTKIFFSQKSTPTPIVTNNPIPIPPPIVEPPPVNNNAPRIDVVFTIDSTSSMSDEIQIVKENIRNIINDISQGQPAPDVRYAIVTYRDRYDEYVTKHWPFTRDVQEISHILSSIVAAGGGDKPESVNEALNVTLHKLDWDPQARSKIVFLIGDAGPNNYADGPRWEDELLYAQRNNISINTIACSGIWPVEAQVFNSLASSSNGQFANLTYKQELTNSDGSRAVVIEEGGRTYSLSGEVDDKDWMRGADELLARNEAKEISSYPATYSSASSLDGGMVAPVAKRLDDELAMADSVESSVVGGVANTKGITAARPANIALPAEALSEPTTIRRKTDELAETKAKAYAERDLAKDMPAVSNVAAAPSYPTSVSFGNANRTNNLNAVLADSIKRAARQQGSTYGTLVTPLFDFKGSNSGVTKPAKIFIDSKSQLQSLLGTNSSIDINKIDFNSQVVVAVFLGQVNNNSSVTISKISFSGKDLIITLLQQSGSASSNTTTPFHLMVIPRQIAETKLSAKDIFVKFE
ncbi:MAG: VWA domain-containing protein [Acidobacteria bacterium]|nr:VWA domain-containing protein [Acidobacteriota bacterium]